MRKAKCTACDTAVPLASSYKVEDSVYCEPCANQKFNELKAYGRTPRVATVLDPTICSKCGLDNGNSELPVTAGLPLCMPCAQAVMERPFPGWLKASLAALFVLLFVALWHGKPYFKAGKSLVVGERMVDHGRYADAIPYLESVVESAPQCEKCILLLVKAQLLTGDIESAQKRLAAHPEFEQNELFYEVKRIWDRAAEAMKRADEASKLEEQKKDDEALKTMTEAAALYPEMPALSNAVEYYKGSVAFDRKDYNGFTEIAEAMWKKEPNSAGVVAMLASAVACQYAVSGNAAYRQRAEELLERAHVLAQSSPEEQKNYQEYAERIRYRLQSRVIIDKDEYDKRFRKTQPQNGKS
jgi:hypothetical protein